MSARDQRNDRTAKQLMFTALADPTRLSIVELLAANGQMRASDIYANFSVSHPAISQHLTVLRDATLVRVEKRAQQRIYTLNTDTIHELEKWAAGMAKLWNERFDALDRVLAREKRKSRRS